jgi:uncharacterized protein involved in exopolysaccharide biosynthesis
MASGGDSPRALAPLDLVRLVLRRRWLVVGAVLACAATAVGLAVRQTPRFQATATVLLDPSARGGLIASLSMLSPIGSSVVAESEVAVLRSRDVVESVVRPPVPGQPSTPATDGYDLHVGLTTAVRDESLAVWPLFLAARDGAVGGRSPVLPPARLFAHASLGPESGPETPRCVRVEFLAPDRVRISTPTLRSRLGIGSDEARELAFAPGEPLDHRGLRLVLTPRGDVLGRAFTVECLAEYEAIEDLLERYWAAETTRNSGVIRLTVEDADPYRAAETANALVANYLAQQIQRRARKSEYTLASIEGMLAESNARLQDAQLELVRVRTENPAAVNLDATGEAIIAELSKLEAGAVDVDLRRRALAGVLAELRAGDPLALARLDSSLSGGLFVDPITEGYLERVAQLNTQHAELSQTLAKEHPTLADVRSTADEMLGLIAAQLESRITGMATQIAEIEAEREEKLALLAELPRDMLALAQPTLEVRTQQELIPTLIANLKATQIADSTSTFVAQMLDRARPATTVASPRLPSVAAVGGALGLVLGLLAALLTESRRGRLRGRADLEELVPRPMLGTVPVARHAAPAAGLSAAVRALRSGVKNLRAGGAPVRVLGIASIGTTPTGPAGPALALELARSFARSGARVALVDGDLAGRALTRHRNAAALPGLAEALAGAPAQLAADQDGLELLPAGAAGGRALDLAGGPAFLRVLAELGRERDLVLVALPADGSGLLEAVVPHLDGLLLACADGQALRVAVAGAHERVARAGGDVLGTVLLVPARAAERAAGSAS